jgi:uncharacterized repeat protein (TIGR03803 family)
MQMTKSNPLNRSLSLFPMLTSVFALTFALIGAATSLSAQTFVKLDNLNVTNGSESGASLVQGIDGNFYGTAIYGGAYGGGSVFKVTSSGGLSTVYDFCSVSGCPDGSEPFAALVLGLDNNFYGTTYQGGASNWGTIFQLTPSGTLTTLHSFDVTDGSTPQGGMVLGSDGNFYGTTLNGGSASLGTIFKITPTGTYTVMHNFTATATDGGTPFSAPMQASDGNFYGVTWVGGNHFGVIYKMTPSGTFSVLHTFCNLGDCTDGSYPLGGITQARNGDLYGTTTNAGFFDSGTVYKITLGGTFTTVYHFCQLPGCEDGINPLARMELGTDGNFYGITESGGISYCCGIIFVMTPAGSLSTLHIFCTLKGCPDGEHPQDQGVIQGTDGSFYGAAATGGATNVGTVFRLFAGLGPFVRTSPISGAVGSTVTILGNKLSAASSVTFNGVPATFTAGTDNYLTATVPAGATSGKVQVVVATGTLKSNTPFRILP